MWSRSILPALVLLAACEPVGGKDIDTASTGNASVDSDGDGYTEDEDCDDADASVHPGATEVCDGVDNDCDDGVDEDVLDTFYADSDGDGFGDADTPQDACDQPPDHVPSGTDCDDTDDSIYPSAAETCNGVDDDCDGDIDEGIGGMWYPDTDDDGFGDEALGEDTCDPPEGWIEVGRDCDDTEPAAFPGAVEVCDEVDNDCDGDVDEDVTTTFYQDVDGDGYGESSATTQSCGQPEGYSSEAGDCDDADFDVFPGAPEYCNDIDDNCDGTIDEADALDASTWHLDADGDTYGLSGTTTVACDQPSGYAAPTSQFDCDDTDAAEYPGADEYCDGDDDDCDGTIDEDDAVDASTWYADSDTDGYGGTRYSMTQCYQPTGYVSDNTDCDDLDIAIYPGATELCNGVDDDCDGTVDNGLTLATYYADDDGDSYGDASVTTSDCAAPTGYVSDDTDCDDTEGAVNPGATEVCNTIDDDCDGYIDDDDTSLSGGSTWYFDDDSDGYGDAFDTTTACNAPTDYVSDATDCDDTDSGVHPYATELCDGIDNDCDSSIDEGVLGTGASCPAVDCAEILADDPSATDGTYTLYVGSYYCDQTTDGGGWTRIKDDLTVWGTSYDTTYYNSEGFTWTEVLFGYDSGSLHAHCSYPGSLTGCNNLGFQFASESWGVPLNWGSSICGMSTTDYTSATSYIGGYDFVVSRTSSTDTVRLGALEAISGCTTSDNPGSATVDVFVRP
jgi:large repetitive protein